MFPFNLRFYPTYEELKWLEKIVNKAQELSFYPTYEELKYGWFIGGFVKYGSFYPTYEELKLNITVVIEVDRQ